MRTRRALLRAARELLESGQELTIEAVAEAALVSRATAYRYYSSVDALTLEAVIEMQAPDKESLIAGLSPGGPENQIRQFQDRWIDFLEENEVPLRKYMSLTLGQWTEKKRALEIRGNRRIEIFEELLEPMRDKISAEDLQKLKYTLCVLTSLEAMWVLKDACQLSAAESRSVIHWASRVLLQAFSRAG